MDVRSHNYNFSVRSKRLLFTMQAMIARFELFTAMLVKIQVLCDVTLCVTGWLSTTQRHGVTPQTTRTLRQCCFFLGRETSFWNVIQINL